MYKNIATLAFVLLVSVVASSTVPIAKRNLNIEITENDDTDNGFRLLSSPVKTNKLFECPSGWKFFCFYDEDGDESHCECYKMINFAKECPTNTNKYCSDYIRTECSCSYPKQPNCPPIFDFTCAASTSTKSTWTCTCAGKVWGKGGCPNGFNSHCGFKGCACKKVTNFLSDYTPKPKGKAIYQSFEVEQVGEGVGETEFAIMEHELKH